MVDMNKLHDSFADTSPRKNGKTVSKQYSLLKKEQKDVISKYSSKDYIFKDARLASLKIPCRASVRIVAHV